MLESQDLIIPVYLNQRIVFDLVAMLQGGIAMVTKVDEDRREMVTETGQLGATFGLNKAFSTLLRIDLSGRKEKKAEEGTSLASSEERVHTPSSLFFTLRRMMFDQEILLKDSEDLRPAPGNFIEFSSTLKRNPLVETIDAILAVYQMAEIWSEEPQKQKRPQETKKAREQPRSERRPYEKQFRELSQLFRSEETVDLTAEGLACNYSVMTTLETQYLNDPTMADLVDGTFRVVGKVIRSVDSDDQNFSLVRKNAFGILGEEHRQELINALNVMSRSNPGIPEPRLELDGPAIHVIPVAIFA